jgi:hypothetical protein
MRRVQVLLQSLNVIHLLSDCDYSHSIADSSPWHSTRDFAFLFCLLERSAGLRCVPLSCTGTVYGDMGAVLSSATRPVPLRNPNRTVIFLRTNLVSWYCVQHSHAVCAQTRASTSAAKWSAGATMRAITVSASGQAAGDCSGRCRWYAIRHPYGSFRA